MYSFGRVNRLGVYLLMVSFASLLLLSFVMISKNAFADQVIATIPVGSQPHSIAINSNTNRIYLVDGNGIEVIDGSTDTVVETIPAQVRQIAINPNTNLIYGLYGTRTVNVIDASTGLNVTSIGTAANTGDIIVNPNTNKIYVTWTNWAINCPIGGVQIINGATNTVDKSIGLGCDNPILQGAVNPVTNKVYVFDQYDYGVKIIDGDTDDFVGQIGGTHGDQMAVNPVTNMLYVKDDDSIQVADLSTNTVIKSISVGTNLSTIEVNPTTNKIYVGDWNSDGRGTTVYVIDGSSNTVSQSLVVGSGPSSIGANSNTSKIYVGAQISNAVSVIDGNSSPSIVTINVSSVDLSGNAFDGMWVELWQNGEIIQESSTPFSVDVQSGTGYEIFMGDWENITFDHWEDGTTDARRTFNISEDITLTAFYNTNNPPNAVDDSAKTRINKSITIDVLANDSDPDGDPLSVDSITIEPEHGTATINSDGTITYTPDLAFVGSDSFDYQISDGRGGTDTALVSIVVKLL